MKNTTTDRIEKQIDLNATPARVWRALTNHKEFGQWFGVNLESPFAPGETTRGRITIPGYDHIVMEVVVRKMEPEKLFSFNWHPYAIDPKVDYSSEPMTLVEFRLKSVADGTELTVTESGFDRIPRHRRDEAYRMNDGGWTSQVEKLSRYVSS